MSDYQPRHRKEIPPGVLRRQDRADKHRDILESFGVTAYPPRHRAPLPEPEPEEQEQDLVGSGVGG
jgi:hypothetical protein